MIDQLIKAGVDCFRLNFSHIPKEDYAKAAGIIATIRSLSIKQHRPVGILQDLGGVKLRIGEIEGPIALNPGEKVDLLPVSKVSGIQTDPDYALPFPQPEILAGLKPDDRVYIADGVVCLVVEGNEDGRVKTYVRNAGVVSSAKGVNLPGVKIDRRVLTDKDKEDARFGVENGIDWIGLSFVQTRRDVQEAKEFLLSIGSKAKVMAKIERGDAVTNIEDIFSEVNGIMVARGDLGIELEMETVPRIQKELVRKANELGVVSVVATQMLLSMMHSPRPTRAEVTDIATAVLDGCDAILLSDETAVGDYPIEATEVAARTIEDTETVYPYNHSRVRRGNTTRSVAGAAIGLAAELDAKCIVVTSSGRAAIETSLFRHREPVIVLSHQQETLTQLAPVWGLNPVGLVTAEPDASTFLRKIIDAALKNDLVRRDDTVVIVSGFSPGMAGTTNSVQVLDLTKYLCPDSS